MNQRSSARPRLTGRRSAGPQRVEQQPGRLDRIVGQAERAGEDVRRAARDHAERGHPVVHAVGQQAVDDLVDRAVAAEGDHRVGAVAHRPAGQRGGVAAVAGLLDLEVGRAGQRVGQHVALVRRRGRGARIDDDENPHGLHSTGLPR